MPVTHEVAGSSPVVPASILERSAAGAGREQVMNEGSKNTTTLDWSRCPAVESIPGKVSGAWVFKDTRMPVATVFENLESGATVDEIMEWFDVTREQVIAVLEFAARSLDPPTPHLPESTSEAPIDAHPI